MKRRRVRRDLSPSSYAETVRFLRSPSSRERFGRLLDEWSVATDALEEGGLLYHAQQLRSMISISRHYPEWARDRHNLKTLFDIAVEGANALGPEGQAPKTLWGDLEVYDGETFLDSIYGHPFPSIRVHLVEGSERHMRSGETQRTFRAQYAGHKYSGRSHQVTESRSGGWRGSIQLHRGARVIRTRKRDVSDKRRRNRRRLLMGALLLPP